jgi:hypothetical protein
MAIGPQWRIDPGGQLTRTHGTHKVQTLKSELAFFHGKLPDVELEAWSRRLQLTLHVHRGPTTNTAAILRISGRTILAE